MGKGQSVESTNSVSGLLINQNKQRRGRQSRQDKASEPPSANTSITKNQANEHDQTAEASPEQRQSNKGKQKLKKETNKNDTKKKQQ